MKRTLRILIALAGAIALPPAATHAQQPEQAARLGVLVGEWAYDHLAGGAKCEWLGQLIIHCESTWTAADGAEQGMVTLTRWDPARSVYTAHRFYRSGYADAGFGWLTGDTWTFVYDGDFGTKVKFVGQIDDKVWRYTWYRSRAGGDWEKTSEGSMTKTGHTPR